MPDSGILMASWQGQEHSIKENAQFNTSGYPDCPGALHLLPMSTGAALPRGGYYAHSREAKLQLGKGDWAWLRPAPMMCPDLDSSPSTALGVGDCSSENGKWSDY